MVEPEVAYCVPVMNRLADIKRTLAHNIEVLKEFDGRAVLIVGCFDEDSACEDFIRSNFSEALESGVLVFYAFPPLAFWHFSWAKNAFRDVVRSRYYSSLDGDNFLSVEDVAATLREIRNPDEEVLIHHFSGNWGDGTSGRITLPTRLYREGPYLDEILPRQFDEIGVILRLLAREPTLIFVSRPYVDLFEESGVCREFIERNNLEIHRRTADLGLAKSPENPRGVGYVQRDEKLYYFQRLNAAYTCWRYSQREEARRSFLGKLELSQRKFTRSRECEKQAHTLFSGPGMDRLSRSSAITVYVVNRNNDQFIDAWLAHYRALGVERIVVIDDYSDTPLEQRMPGSDVFVVRPLFGAFRTSKVFWVKALMSLFQAPGSWAITVDIDEFVDVPHCQGEDDESNTPLPQFLQKAERAGWDHVAGLLVDMMPNPDASKIDSGNFTDSMGWYLFRPINQGGEYGELGPIRWGFGKMWPVSFAVDVRHRLFGTIDSLRKIPLFRFHRGLDLNQGYHGLIEHGRPMEWDELLLPERGLLPVRHYKMLRLFESGQDQEKPFERTEQYFDRTQENLARIEAADPDYVSRAWAATPFKRRYTGPNDFPFGSGPL